MKRFLITISVIFCLSFTVRAQSKLGDVACIYITTPNLDSSAALYKQLGFPEINSNTIPAPWSLLSDGSLLIMMRKNKDPYMGLTYYATDVEKIVAQLEHDSIVFVQKPKPADLVKRYYIKSPDGFNIVLSNNLGGFEKPAGATMLTMKPDEFSKPDKYPNPECGVFGEFCHPVKDINKSIAFWKKLGFTVKSRMSAPYPYAIMTDGLMIIGLHQTGNFDYPAITYFGLNAQKRIGQLKDKGLSGFSDMQGKTNVVLKTWEGQHFFIFSMGM